jgi:DNA helicase-2/ATP-dependent DNA helicase PcrA
MERFIAQSEDSLMNFRDIEYKGFSKKESEIIELFYFKFMDLPLLSRMDAVAEYFIDEVETLRDKDMDDEEKFLIKEKFMKMYETRDLYVLYNWFLEESGYPTLPKVPQEKRKLRYEDVYPVLYLKYRLVSQQENKNIKHLVIDEMQDYSWLQYQIIRKMFSCRMTILGDKAQTMEEEVQDVLDFLPKIFGKDVRKVVMNKSYRNTVEIASYANQLAGITDMELFERHGKPVEEQTFGDLDEALGSIVKKLRLGEEEYETAAVIFPTEQAAKDAAALLKEKLDAVGFDTEKRFSYLHRDSQNFKKGVTVTTFYLAKGLEFDQVFGIFPKGDQTPLGKQARYITATRALHELGMYEI